MFLAAHHRGFPGRDAELVQEQAVGRVEDGRRICGLQDEFVFPEPVQAVDGALFGQAAQFGHASPAQDSQLLAHSVMVEQGAGVVEHVLVQGQFLPGAPVEFSHTQVHPPSPLAQGLGDGAAVGDLADAGP